MTKCDFCTESDSKGKCDWSLPSIRKQYCEKAIKRMVEAFKNLENKKLK